MVSFYVCSYDQPLLFSSTGNASVQFDNCQFIVFGDIWEDEYALMKSVQVEFNNCELIVNIVNT